MAENRSPILDPQRMQLAEYNMATYTVNCEDKITVADLAEPGYWAHVAALMKPYDQIWARAEDGSWIAHLTVLGCDRTWAKVHVLAEYKLTTADVSQTEAEALHEVAWKGPQHRFVVIRKSDSAMVKSGFADKVEATVWMKEHEKVT